jgi:GR25 family glycosyltransferase involved in LPS biosynthesis
MIEKLDTIFCINLDRRSDRWNSFITNWSSFNIPIERFSAIDGNKIKTPESEFNTSDKWHNKYSRACSLSHILVLERAIAYGYKEILILEDDAVPCPNFVERFTTAYKQLPSDYDFCYLGGAFHHEGNCERLEHISENIAIAKNTKTTSSYLIKLNFAKRILFKLREYMNNLAVDESYIRLQEEEKMYIFNPRLVHQQESYSDILHEPVYYTHLKDI